MVFYQVNEKYDNFILWGSRDGFLMQFGFLIAEELYTKKELLKMKKNNIKFPDDCFKKIEVSKNKTYWFFGARFKFYKD